MVVSFSIVGGVFLIFGRQLRMTSLLLFILTILINLYIHDFWSLAGDPSQAHETQNFVKNLAIAAGLLVLATKDKH